MNDMDSESRTIGEFGEVERNHQQFSANDFVEICEQKSGSTIVYDIIVSCNTILPETV